MLKLKIPHDKQVKNFVVTLTILLIMVAVFTNDRPFEDIYGYVIIIWLFMYVYVIPYIEKKDMGATTALEYNEDNLLPRLALMIFAVFVCALSFYWLLK